MCTPHPIPLAPHKIKREWQLERRPFVWATEMRSSKNICSAVYKRLLLFQFSPLETANSTHEMFNLDASYLNHSPKRTWEQVREEAADIPASGEGKGRWTLKWCSLQVRWSLLSKICQDTMKRETAEPYVFPLASPTTLSCLVFHSDSKTFDIYLFPKMESSQNKTFFTAQNTEARVHDKKFPL